MDTVTDILEQIKTLHIEMKTFNERMEQTIAKAMATDHAALEKLQTDMKSFSERVDRLVSSSSRNGSPNDWLTLAELAAYLQVTPAWIYDRTRVDADDPIPHKKTGRYLRFSRKEIDRWVDKRSVY